MSIEKPTAYAIMRGNEHYPKLEGIINFYNTYGGTRVTAYVSGIVDDKGNVAQGFHGFHIHEGKSCTGDETDPFKNAGAHYDTTGAEHTQHKGDLPPLLVSDGKAWMQVFTGRFVPEDVVGRTVILHAQPDDMHTQPSGNSGEKIACGEIVFAEI